MSAETARAQATRAGARPHVSHVLVCGEMEAAIEMALLLRRLGEAVTVLADDLRAGPRQALELVGVRVVMGPPTDIRALAEAGAAEARAAIIAALSDLASIEILLAVRAAHPALPLVCCVNDAELAERAERSLGVRTAVCVSTIEAIHLAGCAVGADVEGAFALGDDLVLLRRISVSSAQDRVGDFQKRTGMRVLMIEEREGRCIIGPSEALPLPSDSIITAVESVSGRGTKARPRIVRAVARAARTIRGNTPPPLAWAAAVLALLAIMSMFGFMIGMNISFGDAAYLVLNTISTVGYGDITPFGSGRVMHFFGSFVALLGPALLGTLLLIFARVVLRPQSQVPPSRGHVVIVAPAAVATAVASQFARLSIQCVVCAPDISVDALMRDTNAAAASALIAATSDPVKNVTLGLAAREVNRSIHIVAGGPAKIARDVGMTTPANAKAAAISVAASAALVGGLRYAITIGNRVFSIFEGPAGSDWSGQRPSDVSGSYNFVTLFRRAAGGPWRAAENDAAFEDDETILVAAWRRLDRTGRA